MIFRNVGVGMMDFSIFDDADWLAVLPAVGQLGEGEELALTVSFNATVLPLGDHTATVTASSINAVHASASLAVDFSVIFCD